MPNEYTSAYAPMQSNAQYGQPLVLGQGQQEAMHQAMLQQQQQYNNQSANIAGQPNGLSRFLAPVQQMMMAKALRGGSPTGDNSMLGARTDMAFNSQASPYLQDQVSQLGSSTSNPLSNYNMGTNGWGNYGE